LFKKLDRYILGEFLAPLALVVLGLASLVLMVQLVDTLPRLREWNATLSQIVLFHLFQFPYLATQVLPVGVMLATLVALGGLARSSELAAMGAGGVSRARIALPLLVAAFFISLALFGVSEAVVPLASDRARYIQKVQIEKRDVDYDQANRQNMAKNLPGERQLFCRSFDANRNRMVGPTIVRFDHGVMRQRIDATSAHWLQGGTWELDQGVERLFDEKGVESSLRFFPSWPEDLDVNVHDLMVDSDKREQDLLQLSIAQLSDIIARQDATGADDRKERVCLQLRISYPFSCLILALLGVSLPYLFPTGRRAMTGAAMGLLVSLACGMIYLVFIQVGISLGKSGTLPILLSAWLGNLVFAGVGAFTLWKVNK
jgi:lipopolysaccharide export system permease protein